MSITTVSHALNGKGRISAQTGQQVNEIAEQLGYQPNTTARNLAGGRSGLIGFVVAQTGEAKFTVSDFAYFAELISAASVTALDRGYALMLAAAAREEAWGRTAILEGAIIVDPVAHDPLLESLEGAGAPVVTAGRVPGRERGWWVDSDHREVTRKILDHLAARGARRIALLGSPPDDVIRDRLRQGLRRVVRRARPGADRAGRARGISRNGRAIRRPSSCCAAPTRPTPCTPRSTGWRSERCWRHKARGLSVPHDLMVSGCVDSAESKWARPGLSKHLQLYPSQIRIRPWSTS